MRKLELVLMKLTRLIRTVILPYSAELTEENFRKQTEDVDRILRAGEGPHPQYDKDIRSLVDGICWTGHGGVVAVGWLEEWGFRALASEKGINWLIVNYGSLPLPCMECRGVRVP